VGLRVRALKSEREIIQLHEPEHQTNTSARTWQIADASYREEDASVDTAARHSLCTEGNDGFINSAKKKKDAKCTYSEQQEKGKFLISDTLIVSI
jgi:hypothetical protein